jgi:hypothetical protein
MTNANEICGSIIRQFHKLRLGNKGRSRELCLGNGCSAREDAKEQRCADMRLYRHIFSFL